MQIWVFYIHQSIMIVPTFQVLKAWKKLDIIPSSKNEKCLQRRSHWRYETRPENKVDGRKAVKVCNISFDAIKIFSRLIENISKIPIKISMNWFLLVVFV